MVKHIILWTIKDEYKDNIDEIKAGIRKGLEGLSGQIEGLISIKVIVNGLDSSNADVMLDSSFESEQTLKQYATHPLHVQVVNEKVRPFTSSRVCMDYEIE